MEGDYPDSCLEGDHDFGQAGECRDCGMRRQTPTARFSGGAGARTHPLSDEDYNRQMEKLSRKSGQ